jgi:hypothetical protein
MAMEVPPSFYVDSPITVSVNNNVLVTLAIAENKQEEAYHLLS